MSPDRGVETISLVSAIGGGLVGTGIWVMALFPFAVPLLLLTAAAAVILALPIVALGVVAALVAAPFVAIRWIWRQFARGAPADDGQASASARAALPLPPASA